MRELFIYFRAPTSAAAELNAAVRGVQARLTLRHPSLRTRLLVRPEAGVDGLQTWMETYAAPPVGIDADLQAQIESEAAAALAPWLRGPRHVEVFVDPTTPCA